MIALDGTALQFLYSSDDPVTGVLSFGQDRQFEYSVDLQGDVPIEPIIGLPPETEFDYRLEVFLDGDSQGVQEGTFSTARVPAALPDIVEVIEATGDAHEGLMLGTMMGAALSPIIMNTHGEYVWWHEEEIGANLCTSARLALDGESVYYALYPSTAADDEHAGTLMEVPLDGSEPIEHAAPDIHHDFVELPDGTLAFLASSPRIVGGRLFNADGIVELAPDGTTTTIWSAWDELAYDITDWDYNEGYGWTHANAILYEEEEDAYYVSLRIPCTIVKVARSSGELLWKLGGDASDFEFRGKPFSYQHNFQVLDDGILVFDNTEQDIGASRVVEYSLDFTNMVAEEVWSYALDSNLWVATLGNVTRQPNGNTQIVWGQASQYDEVTPDGESILRLQSELGAAWGYYRWLGDLRSVNGQLW